MYIKAFVNAWNELHDKPLNAREVRQLCAKGMLPGAEKVPFRTPNGKVIRHQWNIPPELLHRPLTIDLRRDNVSTKELVDFLRGNSSIRAFADTVGVSSATLLHVCEGESPPTLDLFRALTRRFPEHRELISRIALK